MKRSLPWRWFPVLLFVGLLICIAVIRGRTTRDPGHSRSDLRADEGSSPSRVSARPKAADPATPVTGFRSGPAEKPPALRSNISGRGLTVTTTNTKAVLFRELDLSPEQKKVVEKLLAEEAVAMEQLKRGALNRPGGKDNIRLLSYRAKEIHESFLKSIKEQLSPVQLAKFEQLAREGRLGSYLIALPGKGRPGGR